MRNGTEDNVTEMEYIIESGCNTENVQAGSI